VEGLTHQINLSPVHGWWKNIACTHIIQKGL
jgi:hypothetical protein